LGFVNGGTSSFSNENSAGGPNQVLQNIERAFINEPMIVALSDNK
jgi:hypothetical protein